MAAETSESGFGYKHPNTNQDDRVANTLDSDTEASEKRPLQDSIMRSAFRMLSPSAELCIIVEYGRLVRTTFILYVETSRLEGRYGVFASSSSTTLTLSCDGHK